MSRPLDRRWSREGVWLPALLLVAALLFLWAFRLYNLADMPLGWVLSDEGHQLYQPLRWSAGQWYYRDFSSGDYPPGTIWLHAALYRLFGVRISVIRALLALVGAGICMFTYSLARRVMPAGWAILAYVLCLTWNVLSLNMGYPSWYCVVLGLGAAWSLLRYLRRQAAGWLVVAGVLLGLSIAMKTTQGAFQWAGLALFLAWRSAANRPDQPWKRRLLSSKGRWTFQSSKGRWTFQSWEAALALATMLLALVLLRSHLTLVNVMLLVLPLCLLAGAILTGRPASGSVDAGRRRSFLSELLWLALGTTVVTAAWVIPTIVAVGWPLFLEGTFMAPFRHSAFMVIGIPWPGANGWLTLAWAAAGLAGLGRSRRVRPVVALAYGLLGVALFCVPFGGPFTVREALGTAIRTWRTLRFFLPALVSVGIWALLWRRQVQPALGAALVLIVAFGSWNFLQVYPFSDSNHLMWSIQPAFIGLAYLTYRSWLAVRARLERSAALALAGVGALPALLIALQVFGLFGHFFSIERGFPRIAYEVLDRERADVYVQAEAAPVLRAVGAAIEARTGPTDTIFDMGGSFFYFYTGRHNATGHDFWWPGFLTEEEIDQVLADLARRRPAVVLSRETADFVVGRASFAQIFPSIAEYIEAHYKSDRQIGAYTLWVQK